MKLFDFAICELTSKKGYSAMLKSFVVVATLYLVSIIQVSSIALPIESDAYSLKYTVEQEMKKNLKFSELECKFEMKSYKECKLAVYKNELSTTAIEALEIFQKLLKILAYVTGMLSIVGFVAHPYIHQEQA